MALTRGDATRGRAGHSGNGPVGVALATASAVANVKVLIPVESVDR
jgi:hypothetical protein